MKEDFIVQDFNIPPHPKGVVLNGKTVRLEPLNVEKHSEDLFESNSLDVEGKICAGVGRFIWSFAARHLTSFKNPS